MSHLSTTLVVDAPAEQVFDLVADPTRNPEWQSLLAEMGDIAGRPGGIGSSYTGLYRVAGRKLTGRFVVTAAERPTLLQVAGTTTGGWTRWTTVIEPRGPQCEIRVSLEYELPGEIAGGFFGLLTGNRLQAELRKTYASLQAIVEAEATSSVGLEADASGAAATAGG